MDNEPGWNPSTLTHCVDSDVLGWLTGVLAAGVLFFYIKIAIRWWRALQTASYSGRKLWGWLIVIFLVCAMAGYTSWILSLFVPKVSVVIRLIALSVLWVACPSFLYLAKQHKFHLVGTYEAVGKQMMNMKVEKMTREEVASYAIDVLTVALAKTNLDIDKK